MKFTKEDMIKNAPLIASFALSGLVLISILTIIILAVKKNKLNKANELNVALNAALKEKEKTITELNNKITEVSNKITKSDDISNNTKASNSQIEEISKLTRHDIIILR